MYLPLQMWGRGCSDLCWIKPWLINIFMLSRPHSINQHGDEVRLTIWTTLSMLFTASSLSRWFILCTIVLMAFSPFSLLSLSKVFFSANYSFFMYIKTEASWLCITIWKKIWIGHVSSTITLVPNYYTANRKKNRLKIPSPSMPTGNLVSSTGELP